MERVEAETGTVRASLELLYHISRELTTALDLRTVLQRVLVLSIKNVNASNGSIIVLDDREQLVDSAIIVQGRLLEDTTRQLRVTYERGLAGWVVRNLEAVLIPDTSKDERWLRRPDDDAERSGPKSAVSAPLMARDRLVGVMTLVHNTPGFFTADHLALVQAIADQASIAVLNARLYADSQRQARVMTAVAESAAFINASLKLDDVLQRILDQISLALRTEAVFLALIDLSANQLELRASTQRSRNVIGTRRTIGQGIAGWVAQFGRGVVVNDVEQDPRYDPEIGDLMGVQAQAVACAPIRSRGQVIGVLEAINPQEGSFDPDALLVLTGIGSLAGTAIRHAQLFESLEAAHQRYRELFEDSIDPILVTDWEGKIVFANRQATLTTGIDNFTLQSTKIDQFQVIDWDALGINFSSLASGETISFESEVHTSAGRNIPMQVYVRKVQIEEGSHLQWILRDITERKDLDNLRNDLTSMIYHDLRSPLANVVSSLDVLAAALPAGENSAFRSLLDIAVRSTERIQRLTNSLLDINRLEAGQPIGNRQVTTPLSLVRDALEAVEPVAANKSVYIQVEVPNILPKVWVDADMIKRVLINLMENAIKYTPQGSKIRVGARWEEINFVLMWVDDNGPGIPVVERIRIFDKFTRLHEKDGPRGLGLGLAYCRLAVEGHGGRIWVDSEPGCGASFKFTLPVEGMVELEGS